MDSLILGLDLCDEYTQLSCYGQEMSWTLPTVVCRKKDEDLWIVGEDAYASTLMGDGVIVDKLLSLLLKDGTSTIGGIKYKAVEILGHFLEQVLKLPLNVDSEGHIPSYEVACLVITVQSITAHLVDNLMYCADFLNIPRERVHVISHTESFLYYVMSQKREVWSNQVGMFDLSDEALYYYEMKVQRAMKVTVIAECEKLDESFSLDILDTPSGQKLADKILCSCADRFLQKKLFSSIFLTGKGFENQDWAPDFMHMVCSKRKVYSETSLFSQGAACKAEDLLQEKTAYPYVMICDGRLDTTVAIKVIHQDRESQLVLAGAGDNWYEAKTTVDFILDKQNYLDLMITPSDQRKKKTIRLTLDGFPQRDDKTVRVQLQIGFLNDKTMVLVVKDKGFGDFYPSTGAMIRQEVRL